MLMSGGSAFLGPSGYNYQTNTSTVEIGPADVRAGLINYWTEVPYPAVGTGALGVSAGTNSLASGTVVFSNSNGVTFGMDTAGVVTATVQPGAAAGIAAVQMSNSTYTSGTVIFSNANGISFGSSAGGAITGSYTVPTATVFSNSNNVSFGLNGSTVTASAAAQTAQTQSNIQGLAVPGTTVGTGTIVFSNSNGLAFGLNGQTVTGSYSVPGATVFSNSNNVSFGLNGSTVTATATFAGGGAALSAAGSSQNAGTIVFSNSNGVSFGMNGSTITASQSTLSFSNLNGVTFGTNASTLTASVAAQSNQTVGMYAVSNTTQSSSGTRDARSLSFAGAGVVSVGVTGGTVVISAGAGAGAALSAAGSSQNAGTIVFSNSNNISFGMNGSTITASASAQSNQSVGVYAVSQSTGQSSSSTYDARSLSFAGYGIISIGNSGGTVLISGPATTAFAGINLSAGTTSSALSSIVFSNSNGVSFGLNGSTITASAAGGGAALSAAGSSQNAGTIVFSNSNGVSFGMNGSTITASAAGGGVAIAASNSTFTSGTVVLSAAGGALTISNGAQSALFSVPQTSSLSATGLVSISVNGSTISIGAADIPLSRMDLWQNGQVSSAAMVNASASVRYVQILQPVTFSRVDVPALFSLSTSATTNTAALNISSGLVIYSRNGSTLSPITGAFGTTTYTWASNSANWSSLTGGKNVSFPLGGSLSAGEYWVGYQLSTNNNSSIGLSTTQLGATISNLYGVSLVNSQFGDIGNTYAKSQNISSEGLYSGTISATNATLAISDIGATSTAGQEGGGFPIIFRNY